MVRTPEDDTGDALLRLAGAVAEGTTIDWDAEAAAARGDDASLVGELRALERIVAAHRRFDVAPHDGAKPRTWAHLTIVERIASGSFGTVYRAHDDRLNIDVALKLLEPHGTPAHRVLDEARRLAKIRHPSIVQVYGADDAQHRVGLWMELVKGQTLEALLDAQGPLGPREAALVGIDLCSATAAVHAAGLIHGDIKARNVMREDGGRIVLMDFGAGRERDREVSGGGAVEGTPAYTAPDVLAGASPKVSSDIYALGVLLFHLVTKTYPVVTSESTAARLKNQRGERLLLRDARPDLPAEFVRVVERALAVDPSERFQSAGALESALNAFVDGTPEPRHVLHRRRPGAWLGAAVGIVFLSVAGWWMMRARESDANTAVPRTGATSATAAATYDIDAQFHKVTRSGEERLQDGDRLGLGDRLFITIRTSIPIYVYIVNEPDQGQPFLLFPLKGRSPENPLAANETVRVPAEADWQVTTRGGREHFVIFASPGRVAALEQEFDRLDTPTVGAPVLAVPLPSSAAERLRGVGGLVSQPRDGTSSARFSSLFTVPLGARETTSGLWIRQLIADNP